MKHLSILIILSNFLFTSCLQDEDNPFPEAKIEVSGQLVFSCDNPVPLANLWVGIGRGYVYTDTLGNFSGKVFVDPINSSLYLLGSEGRYNQSYLVTNLPFVNTELGVIYASKPQIIPLIVNYNLSSLKLNNFLPIKLEYSKLGPNADKLATNPTDLLKPDTILIDTKLVQITVSATKANNLKIPFLNAGVKQDHSFLIKDFCGTNSTVITFRKQE